MIYYFDRFGLVASGFVVATLRNTRSKFSLGCSASRSRAKSKNRLNCSGLSGCGLGLRGMEYL
jgi:hypothetical protein